jgi:hypothetical protein
MYQCLLPHPERFHYTFLVGESQSRKAPSTSSGQADYTVLIATKKHKRNHGLGRFSQIIESAREKGEGWKNVKSATETIQ